MMAISQDDFIMMQKMLVESRHIDPIIYGLFTSFTAFMVYMFKRIVNKIDNLEQTSATKAELTAQCDLKHRRLDDFTRELVTKEHCDLTSKRNDDKFQTIHYRLDKAHEENKEGHEEIKKELKAIDANMKIELKSIDTSIKDLAECVTRLSAGVNCE